MLKRTTSNFFVLCFLLLPLVAPFFLGKVFREQGRLNARLLEFDDTSDKMFVVESDRNQKLVIGKNQIKLITFNILAPCYKRVGSGGYESETESAYMSRMDGICDEIITLDADIVNIQEYWFGSDKLLDMFRSRLKSAGYFATELRRTCHWRERGDGDATMQYLVAYYPPFLSTFLLNIS